MFDDQFSVALLFSESVSIMSSSDASDASSIFSKALAVLSCTSSMELARSDADTPVSSSLYASCSALIPLTSIACAKADDFSMASPMSFRMPSFASRRTWADPAAPSMASALSALACAASPVAWAFSCTAADESVIIW